MALTSKQRAELRSKAHHLSAVVHVGQQGVTADLIGALDDALRTQELVKVQIVRTAAVTVREAAAALASETQSDVVQTIGKTATFFRQNPELEKERRRKAKLAKEP